jgi:prepilin-type N-terminal cleavage/methylation domain-containing protein/prepilin-type processing-associated H-X9-DG protein
MVVKAVCRTPFVRHSSTKLAKLNRRYRTAFTLVEVLVVLGIIAVLVSILAPAVTRAKEQANQTICLSHLHQLGIGFVMYTEANKGYFPTSGVAFSYSSAAFHECIGCDWIGWPGNYKTLDGGAISPFVGRPNPMLVGDTRNISQQTLATEISGMNASLFRCPSDIWTVRTSLNYGPSNPYPYSYAMNEMLGPGYGFQGLSNSGVQEQQMCTPKITQVVSPSSKLLLYEEDGGTIDDGNAQPNSLGNSVPSLLSIRHSLTNKYASSSGTGVPSPGAKGNVCFCDGSAAFITRAQAHAPHSFYPRQ